MSSSLRVKVSAGSHHRSQCPVNFLLSKQEGRIQGIPVDKLSLQDEEANEIPVQWEERQEDYLVSWLVDELAAGQTKIYTLAVGKEPEPVPGVQLVESEDKVDVLIKEEYFTSYVFDPSLAKPYIGPVIGPYGDSYTRLDFTIKEHPHQRSVWAAIGDVNGIDMWNEPAGVHGKQRHQAFEGLVSGSVFGRIAAFNTWTDFQGNPQVDEYRTVTVYNTSKQCRIMDMEIFFKASYGKVVFGPTKEAGPLGIRVAESMKVDHGGSMMNSYGAVGEEECWGKRAMWCDYHGMVEGHHLGIAVFDSMNNEDYPTFWHIRNYGLMAANNFYFLGEKKLNPNEIMRYRYRILFHEGDTKQAGIGEHYHNYVNPPKIELMNE